jgi:hypothetical protein
MLYGSALSNIGGDLLYGEVPEKPTSGDIIRWGAVEYKVRGCARGRNIQRTRGRSRDALLPSACKRHSRRRVPHRQTAARGQRGPPFAGGVWPCRACPSPRTSGARPARSGPPCGSRARRRLGATALRGSHAMAGRAPRPWGLSPPHGRHVGARRPLARGLVSRVPRPQPVAAAGAQGAHGLWRPREGVGPVRGAGAHILGWGACHALGGPGRTLSPWPRVWSGLVPGVGCPLPRASLATCRGPGGGGEALRVPLGVQRQWFLGPSGGPAVAWGATGAAAQAGRLVRGPRACPRAGCGAHPAPNKRLQATARSVRCAPASGRA